MRLRIRPTNIISQFVKQVAELEKEHDEIVDALKGKKLRRKSENLLAEQFAISLTIAWETFLDDLLLAYLHGGHHKYLRTLEDEVRKSLKKDFGKLCSESAHLAIASPLSKKELRALIDPKGRNLSVTSSDKLSAFARKHLLAGASKKFILEKDDRNFYDFLFALRNYLAHRSSFARAVLKDAIVSFDDNGLNRGLHDGNPKVEAYLREVPAGTAGRMKIIYARVKIIAKRF